MIAFDAKACDALLALSPGEAVALAGELTPRLWQTEGKAPRVALDLLAHAVLSTYAVCRRRRAAGPD